ncbi:MAG: NosD domain-containing protein [Methanolobus sp.]|nr:NosD domain-containing protein [Methanolobus sp.]
MKLTNILITMVLLLTINCSSAATITVDTHINNTDYTFSSIQDAIDHAQENDSIALNSGVYHENLIINKSVNLYSFTLNPRDVIIKSNESSLPVIRVLSDNVKINGITITGRNYTYPTAGVFIDNANRLQIQNNVITHTLDGLYIEQSSGSYIQNNTIFLNAGHGIYLLDSTLNNLENNNIRDNKRGIYLDESDQNKIADNKINNNHVYGIALRKSSRNTITQNQLTLNNIGTALTSSDDNMISGNNVNENKQYGLHLWQSNSNSVTDNSFVENNDSGIRLISLSSNNIFEQNTFSNNWNGITIESTDNNIIKNNKFHLNKEYGIYHLFPDDKNIIEDNSFSDNRSENIKLTPLQELFIFIVAMITLTIIAFYFRLTWLKKGLLGLSILIVVSVILLIAWYFPFESGLPGNNIYVENLEINASPIGETHSRVTLSMNLNYLYKDSFSQTNDSGQMTDNLPVFVQVLSSIHMGGPDSGKKKVLECEEEVVLEYLGENPYECTIELKSGREYYLEINVQMIEELPYPHPSYGETKWKLLGGLSEKLDLR